MEPQLTGRWFRSDSRYDPLFHAELRPTQENSGKSLENAIVGIITRHPMRQEELERTLNHW